MRWFIHFIFSLQLCFLSQGTYYLCEGDTATGLFLIVVNAASIPLNVHNLIVYYQLCNENT